MSKRRTARRAVSSVGVGLLTVSTLLLTAPGAAASDGGSGRGSVTVLTPEARVDVAHELVTLPLFRGSQGGSPVWYVITDDSDQADAQARGLNYVPKLANALGTKAVQQATVLADGSWNFTGGVDFSPVRQVTPGPAGNEFLGGSYTPGANGDANYSPLVTTGNGIVYDATPVQNASGVHDSIASIDLVARTATFHSFFGFWNGHRTVYLHQDASSRVVAAAEGSIYAPNLDAAPGLGSNDPETSARSAIIPILNGEVGATNPARQGLNSALRGEGDPLNINQDIPGQGNGRYSPVWDVHPVFWTQAAIDAGKRKVLVSGNDVASAFGNGFITGAGGPANPTLGGFPAAGFISNCPLLALAS